MDLLFTSFLLVAQELYVANAACAELISWIIIKTDYAANVQEFDRDIGEDSWI